MELFKPKGTIDFMRWRAPALVFSTVVCLAAIGSIFWPGLNFGVDFAGGTEVQLHFDGNVESGELRTTLEEIGYEGADVIEVAGTANAFIIRLREISRLPEDIAVTIGERLDAALEAEVESVDVSPGGDRVALRFGDTVDADVVRQALSEAGVEVRGDVRRFGREADHRYEADLVGVADELIGQLDEAMGDRAATADRVEWVGPRAGRQLQLSAFWALLYSIAFIMVYVAFRFDIRFAPGGILALLHDALVVILIFAITGREFNITTIASLLTIIGYSINDTIVIYDRIRENMARHRGMSLSALINLSTTETLSRTIITSGVTMLSILAFFIWGTSVIKDIAFALVIGMISGTYSTIYIAAPLTEWMDQRFFAPARTAMKAAAKARRAKAAAPVSAA